MSFELFIVAALLVEGLTGIVKSILVKFGLTLPDWADQLISLFFGMTLAVVGKMDFFVLVAKITQVELSASPYIGVFLSGLVLSRGSNAVHDLLKRLNPPLRQERFW